MSTNLNGAAILEANFRNVVTLDPEAVKKAVFWRDACYDDAFRKKLGLETENPDCVVMWGEPEPSQP